MKGRDQIPGRYLDSRQFLPPVLPPPPTPPANPNPPPRGSPLRGEDCVDVEIVGDIARQQDGVADDVEGQLAGLGAHQLGLQEGGPLLLQQPLTAHVVLGARLGEGRGWVRGASGPTGPRPRPAFPFSHWALGSAPPPPLPIGSSTSAPPPAQADLADSGHSGRAELVEEVKLAGCLLEEEVDDLSGRDGCHKGGVRCGGGGRVGREA